MIRALKAAVLFIFITGAMLMLLAAAVVPGVTEAEPPDTAPVLAEAARREQYWLRAYNGHIAVFFNAESDVPAIETTIEIDTLRDVDQAKLMEGIAADTYEEVLKLLEDFGS